MSQNARSALLTRLGVLTGRETAIAEHLRGRDGRLETDAADLAAILASDEVLEGLETAALAEIEQIRGALDRLDAGTYGQCVVCGEDIGEGRLHAVPATPFCRAHAQ